MSGPFLLGNWKMNMGPGEGRAWCEAFLKHADSFGTATVGAIPPFLTLAEVLDACGDGHGRVGVGAQTCHHETSGAFTGETSPVWLREMGCRWVLVGHSERRALFGETDEVVRRKLRAALAAGLEPVVCIGETLAQREGGETEAVLPSQIQAAFHDLPRSIEGSGLLVAYEPVWAIGTGRTATPDQAEQAHGIVRDAMAGVAGEVGSSVPILYGGSVKPGNVRELLGREGVDGALVGGASLDPGGFAELVQNALF